MTYKQKGWSGWVEKTAKFLLGEDKVRKIKKAKKVIEANKDKK